MDPVVKQMLDGFSFSIKNYQTSLGPDNEKLQRSKELLEKLLEKAEQGADVTALSTDPAFSELGGLVGQLASEPPLPPEQQGAPDAEGDGVPDASVPAAGYHMAYRALPAESQEKQHKYYQRIFDIEADAGDAITFNTLLQEDGVLLEMSREPLIEEAEKVLEHNKKIFSPTVETQQKSTIAAYQQVNTVAELEFEGTKQAELSNVEHEWDGCYLKMIGILPECAQAIEAHGPLPELIAKLQHCYRFFPRLCGMDWDDVFRDERYLYFWNNVFWEKMPAVKKAKYRVTTPEGYRDVLKKQFFDPFIKDEPVPEKSGDTHLRFWRQEYPISKAKQLLDDPPRPEIEPE